MKKVSTFTLRPGMVIGEDVLGYDRKLILAKGTVLTEHSITQIELSGTISVVIDDSADSAESKKPESLTEDTSDPNRVRTPQETGGAQSPTYSERVKASEEFKQFKAKYDAVTENFSASINDMLERNTQIDTNELLEKPLMLVNLTGGRIGILDMLQNMREYDDSTYAHCMNVALINYVAAGWLDWSEEDQKMAMLCGLLHDIGKLKVNHDILTKPGKLDSEEYSKIQQHTLLGYKILKAQNVSDHVRYAALMHHERYDGSGYPMRLAGGQIDRFALLTGISDVYDAMTSARCYRGPLCPFTVIDILEDEGLEKYNPEFILTFLQNTANTYIQNSCKLSDGRIGDIIMLHKEKLSRPVVLCGHDYVDLKDHPGLLVSEML